MKQNLLIGLICLLLATLLTFIRNESYFFQLTPCQNTQAEQLSLLGKSNCTPKTDYQNSSQFYHNYPQVALYSLQNLYFSSILIIGMILKLTNPKNWLKPAGFFILLVLICSQNTWAAIFPSQANQNLSTQDISFLRSKAWGGLISSIPYISFTTLGGILIGQLISKLSQVALKIRH